MGGNGPANGASRISLSETSDFDLGGLLVCPAHREVRMNGTRRELEPRVVQVLVALAGASPAVVSRDRLIEQCWDGRIVGDDALNRCILALRHLAQEFSPPPFAIETVPRVGYCLTEHQANGAVAVRSGVTQRRFAMAAICALMLVGALTLGWLKFGQASAAPASIAVMPFRNLSAGDPYFAQGIGEEILAQLAREPQFRVAGSTSSAQLGANPDVREAARKLKVDFVVEGSVRRQGDQVRVNADLLRAKDGVRLWSDSFDGKLDDILQIQSSIGQAVATGLKRKLVFSVSADRHAVNGQAYALYLNARGLLRSGNPQSGQDAVALLREAIRVEPRFAPAWASLADALQLEARGRGNEALVAVLPEAYADARHALQLDPDLAEAHGAIAELLGSESPEAIAHYRRAAALEPRTGEGMMWSATAFNGSGEFDNGLAAFRRAHDLDPLWPLPMRAIVDSFAIMGDRAAAEAAIRSGFPDDPMTQEFAIARVARLSGDFSEAAANWSIVAKSESRWAPPSKSGLDQILFALKLAKDPPPTSGRALIGGSRFVAAPPITAAPSPARWRQQTGSPAAAVVYADENVMAAKLMLEAGRSRELVATYDSPMGLLRIHKGETVGAMRVRDAPIVALALRREGRTAEADDLLRRADSTIRTVYARGRVPVFFDEDAAGVWAGQGKVSEAMDALERAYRRGWYHIGHTDFATLQDEPAFHALRGDPRFDELVAKHAAHFARERLETSRALKIAS